MGEFLIGGKIINFWGNIINFWGRDYHLYIILELTYVHSVYVLKQIFALFLHWYCWEQILQTCFFNDDFSYSPFGISFQQGSSFLFFEFDKKIVFYWEVIFPSRMHDHSFFLPIGGIIRTPAPFSFSLLGSWKPFSSQHDLDHDLLFWKNNIFLWFVN